MNSFRFRTIDAIIILILGEIVGAAFFAIARVQGLDVVVAGLLQPQPEFEISPQTISTVRLAFIPLFFLGVPIAAFVSLLAAFFVGRRFPVLPQVSKFIAVGVSNTAIDWGVLNLLLAPVATSLFGISSLSQLSQLYRAIFRGVSFLFATLNSYFWNKTWTFQSKEKKIGKEATQFYFFTAIGLLINVAAFSLFQKLAPDSKFWVGILAPGFATIISAIWDF